ncbi:MAG: hypothetical protein ATN32_03590 [Candidatus Epulonipiscium fishelsonii]|nr:MAG: hypothetical protein ATN32_03590 [Epulopiscium sp. AS2M-Bin002]
MINYIKLYWKQNIGLFFIGALISASDIVLALPVVFGGALSKVEMFSTVILMSMVFGFLGMFARFKTFINMKANRKHSFWGITVGGLSMSMLIFFIAYLGSILIDFIYDKFYPILECNLGFGTVLEFNLLVLAMLCVTVFALSQMLGSFLIKFKVINVILCMIFIVPIMIFGIGFATPAMVAFNIIQGNSIMLVLILSALSVISIGISYIISVNKSVIMNR